MTHLGRSAGASGRGSHRPPDGSIALAGLVFVLHACGGSNTMGPVVSAGSVAPTATAAATGSDGMMADGGNVAGSKGVVNDLGVVMTDGAGGAKGGLTTAPERPPRSGLEVLTDFRVLRVIETPDSAIFVEDDPHVLRMSTDNGTTWKPTPRANFAVGCLGLNSLGEVLVGTRAASPTVYTCTVAGCTQAAGFSGAARRITAFTKDVAGVIYASNIAASVLHRSNDHGHTWTTIHASLPNQPSAIGMAWAIEANAYGLMMGGEIGPIVQSTDGGLNWVDRGLFRHSIRTPTDYSGNLWAIATDPVTGNVFAAVGDPGGVGGIQVHRPSDPLGVWHPAQGLKGSAGEDFSGWVFQADGSILAAALVRTPDAGEIYKSTDKGATWVDITSTIGVPLRGVTRIHRGVKSGCLYIAHKGGLLRNCSGY